jgi:hypothetical protein
MTKHAQPIPDLETLGRVAGPTSPDQWAEGRSAMEAARAWVGVASPELPPEVSSPLASHPDFAAVTVWPVEPLHERSAELVPIARAGRPGRL